MTCETLIIFSRYPEAGKTKTRMIPALGAAGAAQLQREMTEYTLNTARQLKLDRDTSVEVHFAGGDLQLMSEWLGKNVVCFPQISGDLGEKMCSAFARAFQNNSDRVVIIGIDCPDIDLIILNEAFDTLQQHNLVLGGAKDGGYYLIGLSSLIPDLFENIDWGTDRVFSQTQEIIKRLNIDTNYLPTLRDVDRPEDLFIWRKYQLNF